MGLRVIGERVVFGLIILAVAASCSKEAGENDSIDRLEARLMASPLDDNSTFELAKEIQARYGSSPASRILSKKTEAILKETREDWGAENNSAFAVVMQLANCNDRTTIPILFRCLKHDDYRIRYYASHALQNMTLFGFGDDFDALGRGDEDRISEFVEQWRQGYDEMRREHPEEYWPALLK